MNSIFILIFLLSSRSRHFSALYFGGWNNYTLRLMLPAPLFWFLAEKTFEIYKKMNDI